MGRPKQLLPYRGKSLLGHAVDAASNANADPVIVVLGANAALVEKEIAEKRVCLAENKDWREGMASSVRCGITTLLQIAPATEATIIMVCDQPFVTSSLLDQLITTQKNTGRLMAASQYKNAVGTPALFHRSLFPELLQLQGDAGARKIIEQRKNDTATVPFAEGGIDIDTEADYQALS